jgi:2-methylcitrate synthase
MNMAEAQLQTAAFKPKKSVALSGVTAGNTALCTVGKTGNDLHYRGYDILDIATECEFEEIAYLLVHEKLPNRAELAAYKAKLKALRVLPAAVATVLEQLPADSHPMDVLRTGVSALGCCIPEANDHGGAGARDIADRLLASLGCRPTTIRSARIFCILCTDASPRRHGCARCIPRSICTPSMSSTPRPSRPE